MTKLPLTLLLLIFVMAGCLTSDNDFEKGKEQLEQQGYTNVINTGYSMWCCDEKDTYSTGFSAMAKDSTIIEGCFCSSIIKGVTIRFK